MHGIAQVQAFNHGRRVGRVMIHIVAFTHLVRTPVTATIDSDNAIAFSEEEEHLVIPVIGT